MAEYLSNTPIASIHLKAIQQNLHLARLHKPDSKVMAVVKANAYGHGAIEVCKALSEADAFAVARVNEALELRAGGITKPITVLEGFTDAREYALCIEHNLISVVHSEYQLAYLLDLPIWLKVNSGMSRLGFTYAELTRCRLRLKQSNILGIMSHLANADSKNHPGNINQIAAFEAAKKLLNLKVPSSIANSSAIMGLSSIDYGWIRPGIMLYGSLGGAVPDARLQAAMTLTAPVIRINTLPKGDAIGYGSSWAAQRDCRVAVVGLGYADGYPREMPEGAPVIIGGKRRQLVGRISMDMSFVLLAHSDNIRPGDRVEFWGKQLPIDEVANFGATIGHTLMSGLTHRVKRVYQWPPGE